MGKIKNIIGQKFSRLQVIKVGELKSLKNTTNKLQFWICKCDCGNECEVSGASLRGGHTNSCGCLAKEVAASFMKGKSFRKKHEPHITSARMSWRGRYSDGLSFDDFYKLSQLNCFYCNAPPSNCLNYHKANPRANPETVAQGDFIYNGLDRIDSAKDHSLNNVVTCCKRCNYAKRERTKEDFYLWLQRLISNIQTKNLI